MSDYHADPVETTPAYAQPELAAARAALLGLIQRRPVPAAPAHRRRPR